MSSHTHPADRDHIPVGLSTVVGLAATAILGIVAGVTAILDGDHTEATISSVVSAAFVLYGVIRSRGEQAAAKTHAAAGPVQVDAEITPNTASVSTPSLEDDADGIYLHESVPEDA